VNSRNSFNCNEFHNLQYDGGWQNILRVKCVSSLASVLHLPFHGHRGGIRHHGTD
jgi:hypothetical protein